MILNSGNEIDKKLSAVFQKEVIENLRPDNLDYLAMKIKSESSDIGFKIYYSSKYSKQEYLKNKKDPLINYLCDNKLAKYLNINLDEHKIHNYEVKLYTHHNDRMIHFFEYLYKNISFLGKYKDEITKISDTINTVLYSNLHDYSPMYFFSFKRDAFGIIQVNLYWFTKQPMSTAKDENIDTNYDFKFLEKLGISKLEELLPISKELIKNCHGKLLLIGINYTENYPEKHKIYVTVPKNISIYDGLIKTFSDDYNYGLESQINLIRVWHEIHPEFYCDGFAIGKDNKDNFSLNIYFRFFESG